MTDEIRVKLADVVPQDMSVPYVERVVTSSTGTVTERVNNKLTIHTGVINILFPDPDGGFAGGDQQLTADVTSFLPYANRTVQDWSNKTPEWVAMCSVSGFRIVKAEDESEFGEAQLVAPSARVVMAKQNNLEKDPVAALLKFRVAVRGGNFYTVAYHVTLKDLEPRSSRFDPGDAPPEG